MIIDSEHAYIIALIFGSVLAWFSFFSIIFFTNPQSAGILGVAVLYVSLAVGLAGFFIFLWQLLNLKKN